MIHISTGSGVRRMVYKSEHRFLNENENLLTGNAHVRTHTHTQNYLVVLKRL